MPEKIAIKLLSASDCTLFAEVFKKTAKSGQKCINLNADILTGQLYPNLDAAVSSTENGIPIPLTIYGPNARPKHSLTRKITKKTGYKNWRLNGEVIGGPLTDSHRYDDLGEGDIAILRFHGDGVPTALDLILVGQADMADGALHTALHGLFDKRADRKTMVTVTAEDLAQLAESAGTVIEHPVYVVAVDSAMVAALEDAAFSGPTGTARLLQRPGQRVVSADALAVAKAKAEAIGRDGEGLVNVYFGDELRTGLYSNVIWISAENAIAPCDFELTLPNGSLVRVDVKSTAGPFDNVIHISMAEMLQAASSESYRIFRIYDLSDDGANLRVSENIREMASRLVELHQNFFPSGVRIDSFSVSVSTLVWQEPIFITRPTE